MDLECRFHHSSLLSRLAALLTSISVWGKIVDIFFIWPLTYSRGATLPLWFLGWSGLDEVEIRDNRYDQVIHMVSAANGAEKFYSLDNHTCRSEDIDKAKELDKLVGEAWVGHPYLEVVDNRLGDSYHLLRNRKFFSV